MDMVLLHTFTAVIEHGGALRASVALGCAQSNVTTRLKQLEQRVGTALFDRRGKRLQLNDAGKRYLPYAQRILALVDEAAASAREAAANEPLLRLGCMESSAALYLRDALNGVRSSHPALRIELKIGSEPELVELLLEGRIDFALTACTTHRQGLHYLPIFDEPMTVISREDPDRFLSPAIRHPAVLLAFNEGCPYRAYATGWMSRRGLPVSRVQSIATYGGIVACTAAGIGVAVIPSRLLGLSELSEYRIRSLTPADMKPVASLFVHRSGWIPSPVDRATMAAVRLAACSA